VSAGHDAWIAAMIRDRFAGEPHRMLGRCQALAAEMVEAFTDLTLVRGHVECPEPWGRRGHWWCVDRDGVIVDPTAGQFTCGIDRYEEYEEGQPVRLGVCMDCGRAIWGAPESARPTFCSKACGETYAAWMAGGCRL